MRTRAPDRSPNRTRSQVWAARSAGTEPAQAGTLVKWRIPGAATTASAAMRTPPTSSASNRSPALARSTTRSSRTWIPFSCRNHSA